MNSSLEKMFLNYIIENHNRKFYDLVKPHFFKNTDIQFVYNVIRSFLLENPEANKPTPRQILEMIGLSDTHGIITKEILKTILKHELDQVDLKNFLEPKFQSWILINRLKTGTVDIVDEARKFDDISNFDEAVLVADKIRGIINEVSESKFIGDDDDLGSDFDDPESHHQDSSKFKVKTGFETIDHILAGGWDIQTLNILMAETNGGKCSIGSTNIKVKDLNGIEYKTTFIELFNIYKNKFKSKSYES
jgi:replicative DNA helicase